MKVFRLRIQVDAQDDFLREIEIRSDQTFKDLHEILVKSLKFSGDELASFYVSNDEWEKLTEITLIDMSGEVDNELRDDDVVQTIFLMDQIQLDEFLDEPDQKLIYEYDFLQLNSFFIELVEIMPVNDKITYPRNTISHGVLTTRENLAIEKNPDKLKEELLKEFNAIINGDLDEDNVHEDDF